MRFSSIVATVALAASVVSATLVDVCANINESLKVDLFGVEIVVGELDVCLCISAIPLFIQSNVVAIAAVDLVGKAAIETELTNLINSCPQVPACPSSTPKRKRDAQYLTKYNKCTAHETACGVFGGSLRSYECIDTRSDLESCGGCAIPLFPTQTIGHDCSAINGVSDVSCVNSRCVVHRCRSGFRPSDDRTSCVEEAEGDNTSAFVDTFEDVLENLWWKA